MYRIRAHKLNNGTSNVDYIQSPNTGGALQPKFLVIHYTASGPNSDVAKYFSNQSAKVSAHLVVRRDGTIKQCVPFNVVAWHAGKSRWTDKTGHKYTGLNQSSIGIEIENWGPLHRSGTGWLSWTGSVVDPTRVIQAQHKLGGPVRGWEPYTDAQLNSTIEASRAICSAYNIDEIVGHEDISTSGKIDPGPAWNMNSFKSKVFGRESLETDVLVVRSPTGLNIRKAPNMAGDLVRPTPLQDGTKVVIHEREGRWRFVSVLNSVGDPDYSGWVHGSFLFEG